ncbi:unnamed protein product [Paramecium octaurelia]|uniref:Transmembrane protein n=1 Tax=Paramecium octaurelia TaxID=43137 RepID=A0A8S1WHC0_PAROT|nr:unnamed protein product [Paramecium octaurelia]
MFYEIQTYQQCKIDEQKNLSEVYCFWDEEQTTCLERICENGPALAQSHLVRIVFLFTNQKAVCLIKGFFDYKYAIEYICASMFEDKRCVTDGYQCISRNLAKMLILLIAVPLISIKILELGLMTNFFFFSYQNLLNCICYSHQIYRIQFILAILYSQIFWQ